jgi:hypothetical protein
MRGAPPDGAGRRHGVPWVRARRIRAARPSFDDWYRAFGVADLGLKHGLARVGICAASHLSHGRACAFANLSNWKRARWGCMASAMLIIRAPAGERFALVRTYMAHHIGRLYRLANSCCRISGRIDSADPLVRYRASAARAYTAPPVLQDRILRRRPRSRRAHCRSSERTRFDTPDTIQPRRVTRAPSLHNHDQPLRCGLQPFRRPGDHALALDATRTTWAVRCIKDLRCSQVWSAAHQPFCARQTGNEPCSRIASPSIAATPTSRRARDRDRAGGFRRVRRITVTNNGMTREVG